MIEIENLAKTYTKGAVTTEVLKGVSFRVVRGEFVAIMGSSGAGKSTLLNILGGLDQPTSGTYRLDGVDMSQADDDELSRIRNHKIGFVFQQFHLLDRADAMRNVMLPLIYADGDGDGTARAEEAMTAVGLAARKHHHPAELSGGEQQRVAIARAIAKRPEILLCDEPTGALDVRTGIVVLEAIERVNLEMGTLTVIITHNAVMAEMADRVIHFSDGKVHHLRVNQQRKPPSGLEW